MTGGAERTDGAERTGGASPAVTLAPLREADIDELLPIERELFGPERWTARMFRGELEQGHYYLVARDHAGALGGVVGEVAGYGGLAVLPPEEGWINNLAVRRSAQRHGVGRRLLEALLAEAGRRRVDRVLLEVAVDNRPAQRLYGRYGFEAIGLRRGYYQPSNTDALVMARDQAAATARDQAAPDSAGTGDGGDGRA